MMAFTPLFFFKVLFSVLLFVAENQIRITRAFDMTASVAHSSAIQQNSLSSIRSSRPRAKKYCLNIALTRNPLFVFAKNDWKSSGLKLSKSDEDKEREMLEEEAKIKVWDSRRKYIRNVLRFAESVKNYRISNGLFDAADDGMTDAEKKNSDRKFALAITAFVAAAGAVLLRVGGRAALISSLGLDFSSHNPEMKEQLDSFLTYVQDCGPYGPLLFILAWTAVKVFCFDAGGLVLAFASGIMECRSIVPFGGVFQGALFSAFAATVGSSVAFTLAKLDTPLRKKALQLVEEYPSLRGVEKVVAKDGVKAVLTLRLAPLLPIPIGAYNYVYGVTNVSYVDFATGMFLGSIKPYLLDSYLGYFGKSILDGSSAENFEEDFALILALCASVLIGVFASQLASETWESVQKEIELEKASQAHKNDVSLDDVDKGILKEILGLKLPDSVVDLQKSFRQASEKVTMVVNDEYNAKFWNSTQSENSSTSHLNPAFYAHSPERIDKGFDIGQSVIEGLVLTPVLFSTVLDYANPLYIDDVSKGMPSQTRKTIDGSNDQQEEPHGFLVKSKNSITGQATDEDHNSSILRGLRSQLEQKLKDIDAKLL